MIKLIISDTLELRIYLDKQAIELCHFSSDEKDQVIFEIEKGDLAELVHVLDLATKYLI